jgi:hypothetical protein
LSFDCIANGYDFSIFALFKKNVGLFGASSDGESR